MKAANDTGVARWAAGIVVLTLGIFTSPTTRGADIVKVEEDWQLVVASPDPDIYAPQVTTTMSPTGDLSSFYSVLDLNLQNLPSYEAGGMQLQIWGNNASVASRKAFTGLLLQYDNETVTWTKRMTLADGSLSYAIVNGNSQTWGAFGDGNGDGDDLNLSYSTTLANLNGYDPSVSVSNSGIGFASNRVSSLILTGVRTYSASQLVGQDNTPKVIFLHP